MLKKIKPYLLTIMLNRKKALLFAVLLVFGGLIFGQAAYAFLDIPYNIANMQLDSLDFIDNSILRMLVFLALLVGESVTFSVISAGLLDWASSLPIGLDNTLVQTGWNFTSGLVNLSFILIFIVIALSYIFKIETFAMKKTLPRLIIIALLINFSLLFVKMIVDIGWVFQNSLVNTMFVNGNLAAAAIQPLKDSTTSVIALIASIPLTYMALGLIPVPFLSVAGLAAVATLVLVGEGFFSMFSQTILLIILNFVAGFIFLIYTILFLARIGVVWLLAITAPLAFAAFILPQTEKYFHQWLRTLFQWVFLGVVAFFLMGLGIRLFGDFSTGSMAPILGGWNFLGNYYKYIFLFIYLIVAFGAARKFMPMGTEAIWGFGSKATTAGTKWTAERTKKWGTQLNIKQLEAQARAAREMQARLAAGQRLSWQQRVARPWLRQVRPELVEARVMAAKSKLVKEERMRILAKTKDMDEEGVKAMLRAELETYKIALRKDKNKGTALAELLVEKNALKDTDEDFIRKAWEAAGPKDVSKNTLKRNALKRMIHWAKPGDWEKPKEDMEAFLGKLTPSDIENLNITAKENQRVAEMIVGTMRSDLISRLGSQNQVALKNVQDQIEEQLGKKWSGAKPGGLDERELRTLRNLHASSAFSNINLKIPGSYQEIEDRIKNLSQPPQPPKPPAGPTIFGPTGKPLKP